MKYHFLIFLSLVLFSCTQEDTHKRPYILWIYVEDMSADFGCYGEKDITTPQLEALASEDIRFSLRVQLFRCVLQTVLP